MYIAITFVSIYSDERVWYDIVFFRDVLSLQIFLSQ